MNTGILVLTVGAGRENDLEGTLLSPLRKSICDGVWSEVVLLPSQQTAIHVEQLASTLAGPPLRTFALPEAGAEDDVDACHDFFANVLERLAAEE